MSHIKFFTILGVLSFGCSCLSVVAVLMCGWQLDSTTKILDVNIYFLALCMFALSIIIYSSILYLSWLYGEKNVKSWKVWHVWGIPTVGTLAAAVPWIVTSLCI